MVNNFRAEIIGAYFHNQHQSKLTNVLTLLLC